jgi:hypothetical protein
MKTSKLWEKDILIFLAVLQAHKTTSKESETEACEHQRVMLLGPQCKVIEG